VQVKQKKELVMLFFFLVISLPIFSLPIAFAISSDQLQKITIAQFGHVFLYMPLYVALDKGFFKEQGLDVKLVSTGGDEKTFTAVAAGNAQFGVADPTFVAIARQRGQGGKVVARIVGRVPLLAVTFKNNIKTIKQPTDFNGYRIASLPAPSTTYAVITKILQNNGHPVKATLVQGAFGTLSALIKADHADIAFEIEPNASIVCEQGAHTVYSTANYFGDIAFTGMTVSDSFCKDHPDEIQAAVKALAKAMNYIHNNFSGTLAIAKQEFPEIKDSVLKNALSRLIDEGSIPSTPMLSRQSWDRAIALRKEVGDLQSLGGYEQNVDMKFAVKAVK
jgi:NitT/TauT family transport system substrate-binding protein